MAKVKLDYMSLSMRAEGSDDMVRELSGRFLDMADKYAAPGFYFPALPPSVFEDGCRDPEELNTGDMKPLTTPKEVAPGADWDVVAIYDDAGIPSIMAQNLRRRICWNGRASTRRSRGQRFTSAIPILHGSAAAMNTSTA